MGEEKIATAKAVYKHGKLTYYLITAGNTPVKVSPGSKDVFIRQLEESGWSVKYIDPNLGR